MNQRCRPWVPSSTSRCKSKTSCRVSASWSLASLDTSKSEGEKRYRQKWHLDSLRVLTETMRKKLQCFPQVQLIRSTINNHQCVCKLLHIFPEIITLVAKNSLISSNYWIKKLIAKNWFFLMMKVRMSSRYSSKTTYLSCWNDYVISINYYLT